MARPQIATETQILDVANRVLDRDGVDNCPLAAVARDVGLTRAAITFRFDSARKLKLMAIARRSQDFAALMNGLDLERGGNGLLRLAMFIGGLAKSPRNLISFMATSQANMLDEDLVELERDRGRSLRSAIDRAMPEHLLDRSGAIEMFAAQLTGTLIAWSASAETSGEQFLEQRTRVWLRMTGIALDETAASSARSAIAEP